MAWRAVLAPLISVDKKIDQIDTFLLENLVYRLVLDATGYFKPGSPLQGLDPFHAHKEEALAAVSSGGALKKVASVHQSFLSDLGGGEVQVTKSLSFSSFAAKVCLMLWGNRADLSLSAGEAVSLPKDTPNAATGESGGEGGAKSAPETMLLVDHTEDVWNHVESFDRVALILDNCGLALCTNLVFAEMLLTSGCAEHITLYAKSHPVFVSDATCADVATHVDVVAGRLGSGCRLREHLREKRLSVVADPFFTSGHPYREISTAAPELARELSSQDLAIFKGDANYRRLLGERTWSPVTPWVEVVGHFSGTVHTLALRTLKFPLTAGLSPSGITAARAAFGGRWDCKGQCGVIQFAARNRE